MGENTGIVLVLGSVTPPGRLHLALSGALERLRAGGGRGTLIDLGIVDVPFADGGSAESLPDGAREALGAVRDADAVILASPVYRATMTGALKNFLDLLPLEALQHKPVGIVAMGATPHHFLGTASHVRDVCAWFGALPAPTDVYLTSSDFMDGRVSADSEADLDALVRTMRSLAPLGREGMGPTPLAGRR